MTNERYTIDEITGIKLCQSCRRQHGCDFIAAMPSNLCGPGDNYDLEKSQAIPPMLRKTHEARTIDEEKGTWWSIGTARRASWSTPR